MIQNTPLAELAGLARKERCITVILQALAADKFGLWEPCGCNMYMSLYLCSYRLNLRFKTDSKNRRHISASCQRLKGTVQELLKMGIRLENRGKHTQLRPSSMLM